MFPARFSTTLQPPEDEFSRWPIRLPGSLPQESLAWQSQGGFVAPLMLREVKGQRDPEAVEDIKKRPGVRVGLGDLLPVRPNSFCHLG